MPQFFVSKKNFQKNHFFFDPSESRHLSNVLRKQKGDLVQIFDGEGNVFNSKLTLVNNERSEGEIQSISNEQLEHSRRNIHIYPSLIKGPPFEWMLQKLTELGVQSIHPFISQRTVIQFKEDQKKNKVMRWEKILVASTKQCGRNTIPKIFKPIPFPEALQSAHSQGLILFFWEGEDKRELRDICSQIKENPTTPIHLFIGPEGGFTLEEVEFAKKNGALSLRLGDSILRAETAAIAATSYLLLS